MNMFRAFMELDEVYSDRLAMITELKNAGKNYNFNKYSDAQLYRMLQRLHQPKVAAMAPKKEPEHELDLDFTAKELEYCECGERLTDFDQCPVCDLGEEDLDEGIFNTPPNKSNWVKMTSGSASGLSPSRASISQSGPTQSALNVNNKFVVRIVSYGGRLRALATDGIHPAAWVAFPNDLRQFEGQQYEVDQLIWNGKNYRTAGNIVEI